MFIASADIFGADGRGVISYGTSLFASIGIILSFNFGRSFIYLTHQDEKSKEKLLPVFLSLNLISFLCTVIFASLFWYLSESAQSLLPLPVLMALLASSAYYVWSINGNSFFASFGMTHVQEMSILAVRTLLVLFVALSYLGELKDLTTFLAIYSFILFLGVTVEFIILGWRTAKSFKLPEPTIVKNIFSASGWPHLDFLAFNLYPLFLILIAGYFLEVDEIGRINFAIQLINFVYLLSTTANIRVSSYVSLVGFRARIPKLKKLFWGTFGLSLLISLGTFSAIQHLTEFNSFRSFSGSASLFAIVILSIPGYLAYQILNPIWIETKMIQKSAQLSLVNTVVFFTASFYVLPSFRETGAAFLFAFFHLGLFLIQGILLFKVLNTRPNS